MNEKATTKNRRKIETNICLLFFPYYICRVGSGRIESFREFLLFEFCSFSFLRIHITQVGSISHFQFCVFHSPFTHTSSVRTVLDDRFFQTDKILFLFKYLMINIVWCYFTLVPCLYLFFVFCFFLLHSFVRLLMCSMQMCQRSPFLKCIL